MADEQIRVAYNQMSYPTGPYDFDEPTREQFHIPIEGDNVVNAVYMTMSDCNLRIDGQVVDKIPQRTRAICEFEAHTLGSMLIFPDPLVETWIRAKKTVEEIAELYHFDETFIRFRLFAYYCVNISE